MIPVAHHDGNYFADADTLDRLEGEGRVAFRYATDINGSARNIAGVLNAGGNVLGMMPHPERRIEPAHGGTDGRRLLAGQQATVGPGRVAHTNGRFCPRPLRQYPWAFRSASVFLSTGKLI